MANSGEFDSYYFIADYHSLIGVHDAKLMRQDIYEVAATWLAMGLDPKKVTLYKQSDVPEKVIRLHADDTGIYISNNGIEIKPQDKERIFELRFSRKPNGRGLGLSISKEVLNAENYDIFVAQPKEGSTVTFKIQKMQ